MRKTIIDKSRAGDMRKSEKIKKNRDNTGLKKTGIASH